MCPSVNPARSDGRYSPKGWCLHCVAVWVSKSGKPLPVVSMHTVENDKAFVVGRLFRGTNTPYVLDKAVSKVYRLCWLCLSHDFVRARQLDDSLLNQGYVGGAVGGTLGSTCGMQPGWSPVGCGASPWRSVYFPCRGKTHCLLNATHRCAVIHKTRGLRENYITT